MTSNIFRRARGAIVALAVLALGLTLTAPAATAQSAPTLTVTPASIERPATGQTPATLHFSHTGCSNCWVELDPGWTSLVADQAIKGRYADFGAANYWATDVTIGGKPGKGAVPDSLGVKVRPGDGSRRFIRFTLNDGSGVVAEAKVWLTPNEPEYLLNQQGPNNEEIRCWMFMTGGVRTLHSGEEFRLSFSSYRTSDFDFRWHLVSTVDANTGATISGMGLPHNVKWPGGSFTAPDSSFKITYRIQQRGVQGGASSTCSKTITVR